MRWDQNGSLLFAFLMVSPALFLDVDPGKLDCLRTSSLCHRPMSHSELESSEAPFESYVLPDRNLANSSSSCN